MSNNAERSAGQMLLREARVIGRVNKHIGESARWLARNKQEMSAREQTFASVIFILNNTPNELGSFRDVGTLRKLLPDVVYPTLSEIAQIPRSFYIQNFGICFTCLSTVGRQ